MEGCVISEHEYDELEMLLGEIPNATSGNPQAEEHGNTDPSLETEPGHKEGKTTPPSPFTNFYHPPRAAKQGGGSAFYGSLNFGNSLLDKKLQSNGKLEDKISDNRLANQDESNLPDDQSLATAFEELSFKDSVTAEPANPVSVKYSKTSHICNLLFDGQYHDPVNKTVSVIDSVDMSVPAPANSLTGVNLASPTLEFYPPSTSANGIQNLGVEVNSQGDMFLKLGVHELKRQKSEDFWGDFGDRHHTLPMYSGGPPLAPGMDTYQFVSGVPARGVGFPSSAFPQQYFLDAQPPTYLQPQALSQSHTTWQSIEEDRHKRMHQQYFYIQQLQNQGPEINPFQKYNNAVVGSCMGRPVQQYFEMPMSQQIEQTDRDPYWNKNVTHKGIKQFDLALMDSGSCHYYSQGFCGKGENCAFAHGQKQTSASGLTYSGKDYKGVQLSNKVGKHIFPERILTRSQGLNSLKTLKSVSPTTNESPNNANSYGGVLSNGHSHRPVPTALSFHSDGQDSDDSSPDSSDFRLTSRPPQQKYNSVDEVMGRIFLMSKDQHGCRFLQRKFTEGKPEDVEKIFVEIVGHIVELMTDPFGNYLVQKLLEVCNEDQRMYIICEITSKAGELIKISCNMHGTRAVQKVIETLKTPEQYSMIVSSLKPGIVLLIKDSNGNHVAQRCLQYLLPEFSEFLFDAAVAHCIELATDRHGCCVLQKCLSHSDGQRKDRLMSEIISNALVLSQDQFGNYVVQNVIGQMVPWATTGLLDQLEGHFGYLSTQKYSSNVVEKFLKFAGEDHHVQIIEELLSNPRLVQILQDPFGNYVIQSAVKSCKGALHAAFVEAIRPHVPALRSSPFGKKVLSGINMKK